MILKLSFDVFLLLDSEIVQSRCTTLDTWTLSSLINWFSFVKIFLKFLIWSYLWFSFLKSFYVENTYIFNNNFSINLLCRIWTLKTCLFLLLTLRTLGSMTKRPTQRSAKAREMMNLFERTLLARSWLKWSEYNIYMIW